MPDWCAGNDQTVPVFLDNLTYLELHLDPTVQPIAIDVAAWRLDELFSNYPEGARSKYAFFPPLEVLFEFINPSRRYMFKLSAPRYPDQFWGEVVAYQVGTLLGVNVPPAFAAFNSQTGKCGALIEWFYEDGEASFVPGGNYMQLISADYDRKKGLEHNFRWAHAIGRAFAKGKWCEENDEKYWAEAFLFDALIGNTDRHQDNWGYLWTSLSDGNRRAQLSPLFDNGTSLGHERFTDLVKTWQDQDYERYVAKGKHHMKWDKDDPYKCGHFEMIRKIIQSFPVLKADLTNMINAFSLQALTYNLELLKNIELPVPLAPERAQLYLKLISLRKQKIEEALL